MTILLTTLNERRREMAILRSVGAHSYHVMLLYIFEAVLVVAAGCMLGVALLYSLLFAVQPLITDLYGIYLTITFIDNEQLTMLAAAIILGVLSSLIPGIIALKRSLHDGLTVKI